LDALITLLTLLALDTLDALDALIALGTSRAGDALRTSIAYDTLRALDTLRATGDGEVKDGVDRRTRVDHRGGRTSRARGRGPDIDRGRNHGQVRVDGHRRRDDRVDCDVGRLADGKGDRH
jgi:hypothetical protein